VSGISRGPARPGPHESRPGRRHLNPFESRRLIFQAVGVPKIWKKNVPRVSRCVCETCQLFVRVTCRVTRTVRRGVSEPAEQRLAGAGPSDPRAGQFGRLGGLIQVRSVGRARDHVTPPVPRAMLSLSARRLRDAGRSTVSVTSLTYLVPVARTFASTRGTVRLIGAPEGGSGASKTGRHPRARRRTYPLSGVPFEGRSADTCLTSTAPPPENVHTSSHAGACGSR
jgi:hypothetical protein